MALRPEYCLLRITDFRTLPRFKKTKPTPVTRNQSFPPTPDCATCFSVGSLQAECREWFKAMACSGMGTMTDPGGWTSKPIF